MTDVPNIAGFLMVARVAKGGQGAAKGRPEGDKGRQRTVRAAVQGSVISRLYSRTNARAEPDASLPVPDGSRTLADFRT